MHQFDCENNIDINIKNNPKMTYNYTMIKDPQKLIELLSNTTIQFGILKSFLY